MRLSDLVILIMNLMTGTYYYYVVYVSPYGAEGEENSGGDRSAVVVIGEE